MNHHFSKIITILAIISFLAAGSVLAQNKQGGHRDWQKGPPSVEEKLARISAALDLDEQQSREMLVVLQDQEADKATLHEQTMEIMGHEICAQKLAHEQAVLDILTPEQTELFLEMNEQRRTKAERKRGGDNGRQKLDCEG